MQPKILVSMPVYHAVMPMPLHSFLAFSQETGRAEAAGKYSVRWCVTGPKVKTVNARNIATKIALEGGADYILFIDDDMVIPANLLENLLSAQVAIVSPLFFRTNPIEPLVFNLDDYGIPTPMMDYPQDTLFEAPGGVGTGVMLISTDVFRMMREPYWLGSVDPEQGEDTYFCKRAQEAGFRVWCDSSIKVSQMSESVPIGEVEYATGY